MKAQRAFRLTLVLLAMALIAGCRKVDEGDLAGALSPGGGAGAAAASISAVASPAAIVGNGIETSLLTATVVDGDGHGVGAGAPVAFVASRGTITSSALTDANGQARATYTSSVGAGEARINVQSGTASGYTTITLTSGVSAQIVLTSVDRLSIGIRGSGDPETATMVFQVRDAQGIPVGAGVTVSFALEARPDTTSGEESLEPTSDVTDENGIVRTTLRSGTRAGATETVASITSVTPNIESRVVRVSIDGGLPVAANLTVASASLNIPGMCFYNRRTQVLGLVYDEFNNPVPGGTIVYFTTQYGGIQPADTTDDHGVARVDLISANELPPSWPGPISGQPAGFPYGFVQVYAQTADVGGGQIRDSTYVLFSGCTILENVSPVSFNIPQAGSQTFTFNMWDLNHNPLSAGTKIEVTANAGVLIGDVDVTLADVQFGFTDFTFVLADDDPADVEPPVRVAIQIVITSPNGNTSALIVGTLD